MTNPTQQKKRKLTKKQRGFVKDYVLSENGTEAALKNYEIESEAPLTVAAVIASENLNKPYLVEAIEIERKSLKQALMEEGVTPQKIASKINELLDNEDPNAIDKGLKHTTNIYGIIDPEDKKPQGNTYNFIFSPEVQGNVKRIEDEIKAQLTKRHEFNQES